MRGIFAVPYWTFEILEKFENDRQISFKLYFGLVQCVEIQRHANQPIGFFGMYHKTMTRTHVRFQNLLFSSFFSTLPQVFFEKSLPQQLENFHVVVVRHLGFKPVFHIRFLVEAISYYPAEQLGKLYFNRHASVIFVKYALDHVFPVFGLEHLHRIFFRQPFFVVETGRLRLRFRRFTAEPHFINNDAEIGGRYKITDGYETQLHTWVNTFCRALRTIRNSNGHLKKYPFALINIRPRYVSNRDIIIEAPLNRGHISLRLFPKCHKSS